MHSLGDASRLFFIFYFFYRELGVGVMAKMQGEPMCAPLTSHWDVHAAVWRLEHLLSDQ